MKIDVGPGDDLHTFYPSEANGYNGYNVLNDPNTLGRTFKLKLIHTLNFS